jgi:hypothetical protein
MEEFPPKNPKAEPKKVERVTSAEVRRNGDGLGGKLKNVFFGGDARGAVTYVALAVIVPAMRDMVAEAGREAVDRLVYGETTRSRRGGGTYSGGVSSYGSITGQTNYNGISTKPKASMAQSPSVSRSDRARHDFGKIIIPHRDEANDVIDQMFELISRHGSVSVAELYEMTDIRSSHVDVKWGWTNLRGAKAIPHRGGGFVLDLPRPEPLG